MAVVVILALAAAVALPVQAEEGEGAQQLLPIEICDIPNVSGSDEHKCGAQLLDPENAKRVEKFGTTEDPSPQAQPPSEPIGAVSRAALTEPPQDTSPQAHAGLSPSQAEGLFEATYRPLLEGLETSALPPPDDVLALTSDTTAVLDEGPRSDGALLDSSIPLVAGASDKRLNLDLEVSGADFAPKRSLAAVTLPGDAYEPALLGQEDVGFSFVPGERQKLAPAPAARELGDQGLFYPQADTDTDLFLATRPGGFQLFAQLRSAASPSELRVAVDLPPQASLRGPSGGTGLIEVQKGGETIAAVTPPVALDANGESVGARMSVAGDDELLIEVDHQGSGAAYPILVDPEVIDTYVWDWGEDFTGWNAYKYDLDFTQLAFGPDPTFPAGIYNQAPSGATLGAGSFALWRYRVPGHGATAPDTTAYIADAFFAGSFATGSTTQIRPVVSLGTLSSGANEWVRRKIFNQAFTEPGSWLSDGSAPLQPGMSPLQATELDFRLVTGANTITTDTTRTAWQSAAIVKLSDWDDPTSEVDGLGGWSDGSEPIEATTVGKDLGLGVKTQSFYAGFDGNEGLVGDPNDTVTSTCTGGIRAPCPKEWSEEFEAPAGQLRDGLQFGASVAVDALGKATIGGAWHGIDRQPPQVASADADADEGSGALSLSIDAADGDPDTRDVEDPMSLAGAQSGVHSIELLVDGELASPNDLRQQACPGDGISGNGDPDDELPWGSCGEEETFELPQSTVASRDKVEVVLTDQAGNSSRLPLTPKVSIDEEPFTTTGALVGVQPEFEVDLTSAISPIVSLKTVVDGQIVEELGAQELGDSGECDAEGICNFSELLDPVLDEIASGDHTLEIVAQNTLGLEGVIQNDIRLDSSPPELKVSGPLVDHDGLLLPETGPTDASIVATDQANEFDTGVESVTATLDQAELEEAIEEVIAESDCSAGCPGAQSGTLDYDATEWPGGAVEVMVTATDQAGNESIQPISVDVPPFEPDPSCTDLSPPAVIEEDDPETATDAVANVSTELPEAIASPEGAVTDDGEELEPRITDDGADPFEDEELLGSEEMPLTVEGDTTASASAGVLSDGFVAGGAACIAPSETTDAALEAEIVDENAAVFANSAADTDTVLRPTASGLTLIQVAHGPDAPNTYSWTLALEDGASLQQLSDGQIAIVDPGDEPDVVGGTLPPPPSRPDPVAMLTDTEAQAVTAEYDLMKAENEVGHRVSMLIEPPTLVVDGQVVGTGMLSIAAADTIQTSFTGNMPSNSYAILLRGKHSYDAKDCKTGNSPCGHYRSSVAANYASKYAYDYNTRKWHVYSEDCTNFMSQILWRGGMKRMREFKRGQGSWWTKAAWITRRLGTPGLSTTSWLKADALARHLYEYKLADVGPHSGSKLKTGDLVVYEWRGDSEWDHFRYVVRGAGSKQARLVQHSPGRNIKWSFAQKLARDAFKHFTWKVLRPKRTGANIHAPNTRAWGGFDP